MTTAARSPKPAPNTALLDELGRLRARVAELEAREPGAAPSGPDEAGRWARDVGRLLSQTLDPDAVVNRIALGMRVVLRARMSAIFRLDGAAGDLIAIAVSGSVPPAFGGRLVLPADAGAIGLAVRTRQPIVSANVLDDPRLVLPPQVRSALETASCLAVLAVPLIVQDQVAGALEIGDSEGRAFTEADVELAQTLADQATVVLEHARLYAEAQQRVRQTETLLNVSAAVGSTLDLTEVMRRVARETCRALGADMVGAFLPDAAARCLHPIAGYHVPKEMVEAFLAHPIPLGGHPILEEAWAHQRPVWSSDVAGDRRVDRDAVHRFPHRASLFFPIVVRGVPAGAFFAAWFAERHVFGPEEIRLVEGISHQAAVALDNARLHQETEARLRQAETLLRTAHTITSALDLTEVVRRTTREIVRALGADRGGAYRFNADETEIVPIAGYHLPKELVSAPPPVPPETVRALVAKIRESDGPVWMGGRSGAPPFEHLWVRLAPHESILVVKMRAKDEILGAIAVVWTRERHRFTDDDLRLADAIARQAAVAVENARALESERTLQRRQDTLVALGRELAGEIDLQRLLPRVTARSRDLMGADAALLLLLEGSALVFRGAIGVEDELRAIGRLDVNTSLTGVVVREGRPLVIPDLRESPEWRGTPVVTRFGYRAMLAVPLAYQGRTLGVLKLLHRRPRPFGSEDVAFLGALATEAGMAIENARLYDEAARGRREAEAIADLVRTINESLDLGATLERVTQAARRLCGSDVAAVALRDRDGAMSLQYLAGARSGGAVGRRVEDGLGTGGQVLATGRPFRTSNCAADPRITRAPLDAADAEEITAEMVVPVTNEGRIDGLLYVSNRAPRAFTDRDETVLSRLAEHAALAITNAQLFAREQAAREASEVSEERYRNLVESLDAIVWEADAATGALSFVSGSTETILGYPVERWLAEPGFVAEHLHPDDREATVALAGLATLAAGNHRLEYRMLAADGRTVWIHDTVRVVRDGAGRARRLRGVKVDITNLKRAQQYQEIQFGVTRLLAQATSLDEALPVLFERLCRSLGWEFGEVWRVDVAADVLRRGGAWHEPSFDVGGFLEATRELAFARGVGRPGRVWQDGGPVWVSHVTTDARFARPALAATAGIHSAFAFPIRSAREVIGVLVFFSRRVYPPDEH
ncbi:MAG: GAF domain-containing protein, partial [Candidatus Rokubacteria bacterium]|nr:GAF domain-containing protein [Candidatus Rokubacteria bacterium]